jgi:O-methyltransferase involved in polyketide biosynthesis
METEKVHFTQEKETLLITLYCKARESRSENPVLKDETAENLIDRIDYDFRALKVPSDDLVSVPFRAKLLDTWTAEFLAGGPNGTVLHLGCGLDSRVIRIDPPSNVSWYDVDYPDVIELRRRFYLARPGYSMIGFSVTDPRWLGEVAEAGRVMVVAEGLLMYLSEDEVRNLLVRLLDHFSRGQLAFDALTPLAVRLAKYHTSIRKTGASLHPCSHEFKVSLKI